MAGVCSAWLDRASVRPPPFTHLTPPLARPTCMAEKPNNLNLGDVATQAGVCVGFSRTKSCVPQEGGSRFFCRIRESMEVGL